MRQGDHQYPGLVVSQSVRDELKIASSYLANRAALQQTGEWNLLAAYEKLANLCNYFVKDDPETPTHRMLPHSGLITLTLLFSRL